ncbi:MAG: hypothetical protein Q8Q20_03355 [bacterium]|nr:hypothetical protein [bacterium]
MRTRITIIVLIAIVLIAGGSLFVYGQVPFTDVVFTKPFLEDPPEKVVSDAFNSLSEMQSTKIDAAMNMDFGGNEGRYSLTVSAATDSATRSSETTMRIDTDLAGNIEIQTKSIGDKMYFYVDSLPSLPFSDAQTQELNELVGRWYYLDTQELTAFLQENFSNSADPFLEEVRSLDMTFNEAEQEELANVLKQTLAKNVFVTVTKRLPDEEISGVKCYHYVYEVDTQKFSQFIKELLPSVFEILGYPQDMIEIAFEDDKIRTELIEFLNVQGGEVWVQKDTHWPRKMSLTAKPETEGSLTMELNITEVNPQLDITAPEDAMDTLEFIEQFIRADYLDTEQSDIFFADPSLDTDGDGLTDLMEEVYGTDVNNPDSDADGFLDGEEVENGYSPVGEGKLITPVEEVE